MAMKSERKNMGFSLAEVLLAMGVLAIGMIFVAGVFPLGIRFTAIASERTTAAAAADEAFAKIKLYAVPTDDVDLSQLKEDKFMDSNDPDIKDVFPRMEYIDSNEFAYPSTDTDISQKQYYWSALFRRTANNPNRLVQVIVFVSRKAGPNLKYYKPEDEGKVGWPMPDEVDWPMPVKVEVEQVSGKDNEIEIKAANAKEKTFINDGYTIVDDRTGRLYRVLERYKHPDYDYKIVLLDRDWDESDPGGHPKYVWVVPPPIGGGRQPCIAVYQKIIRF